MAAGLALGELPLFAVLPAGASGTSAIASSFFAPSALSAPPPQATEKASTGTATRVATRSRAVARSRLAARESVLRKLMRFTFAVADDDGSMAT